MAVFDDATCQRRFSRNGDNSIALDSFVATNQSIFIFGQSQVNFHITCFLSELNPFFFCFPNSRLGDWSNPYRFFASIYESIHVCRYAQYLPVRQSLTATCAFSSASRSISFLRLSALASPVSKMAVFSGFADSSDSQLGPLSQNSLSLFDSDPRVPRSLGFSVVGKYP